MPPKADSGELDNPRIPEFMTQKYRGMTLLHLAASLGYSRLTSALLRWSADNPVLTLQTEIDALAQDSEGFTPLVSAMPCFSRFGSYKVRCSAEWPRLP